MELEYYGGNGYLGVPEEGIYQVKYTDHKGKECTNHYIELSFAQKFYNTLYCEKSLWDIGGAPELLECHFYPN